MKIKYVAGFLFDDRMENVVLIEKQKPEWQAGLLNGVGGKVESYETPDPIYAMRREFSEEAGLSINDWTHFCTLEAPTWIVYFYYATSDRLDEIQSLTDEKVDIYAVGDIFDLPCINNIPWLIGMARDPDNTIPPTIYRF